MATTHYLRFVQSLALLGGALVASCASVATPGTPGDGGSDAVRVPPVALDVATVDAPPASDVVVAPDVSGPPDALGGPDAPPLAPGCPQVRPVSGAECSATSVRDPTVCLYPESGPCDPTNACRCVLRIGGRLEWMCGGCIEGPLPPPDLSSVA